MKLWIRSQDRKELRPQPKLGIDKLESLYYIVDRYDFEKAYILGKYETEERALEVLDEIQNILKPRLIIKDSGKIIGSFEDTIFREGATYELEELSTFVYQMPEK